MRSWIEQAFGPAIAFAHEQAPLVQAMLAILPKFYSLGNDAEAGPMRWAGNLLPLEPRLHLFEACLERLAVVERAGLEIGRETVCTTIHHAPLVSRPLIDTTTKPTTT